MRLYLVRHGETEWNKERRIQGRADIPLNEFGRRLAEKTAAGLREIAFDVCYTSPLARAKETAQIILSGRNVPIIDEVRIAEMAFGEYEGKRCTSQAWELPESYHDFFDAPERYQAPPGGENFEDVKRRTGGFLEELYQRNERGIQTVLIVTHGAALAGMINGIKKLPIAEYWGEGVHKNCAVTEVSVENGVPAIVAENVVYYDDEVKPWKI